MIKNALLTALFLLTGINYGQTAQWARATGGIDQGDMATNIVVDANGDTYTTGSFRQTTNFDPGYTNITEVAMQYGDVYVQKLSPTGSLLWVKVFKNEMHLEPSFLALDSNNNVYLTSQFVGTIDLDPSAGTDVHSNPTPFRGAYVVKLSTTGEYIWGKHFQFGPSANPGIETTFIAIDKENNILLAGEFQGSIAFDLGSSTQVSTASGRNNFIMKMNNNGVFIWNKVFYSPNYGRYRVNDIAIDSQNNIILGGATYGNVSLNPPSGNFMFSDANFPDLAIVKMDENGGFIWAKTPEGVTVQGTNSREQANAIAVDASDNIYFSGTFCKHINLEPSNTSFVLDNGIDDRLKSNAFFAKMNSDGAMLWARKLGAMSDYVDGRKFYLIDVSNEGHVFIGMNYTGTFTFNLNGVPGSNTTYYDAVRGRQIGMSLAEISPVNGDYLTMYHLQNQWHLRVYGMDARNNTAYIAGLFSGTLLCGNSVSITVAAGGLNGQQDSYAAKIGNDILGIPDNTELSNTIVLSPNPAYHQLEVTSANQKIIKMTLTDLTGKNLGNLRPSMTDNIHKVDVSQLDAGMYILTIYTEEETISKKFLKL